MPGHIGQCLGHHEVGTRLHLVGKPPRQVQAERGRDPRVHRPLHHRRQRHRKRRCELADAGRPLAEPLHHLPAVRIRQRLEHEIELVRLVKHELKYRGARLLSRRNFRGR